MKVLEEFPVADVTMLSAGTTWFPSCFGFVVRSPTGKRVCYVFEGGKYSSTCLATLAKSRTATSGGGVKGAVST